MKRVTFEIRSLLTLKFDMIEYPELTSGKKWLQKGLDILKERTPNVLNYISKQKALSHLSEFKIDLKIKKSIDEKKLKSIFKIWIQKEKSKRLFLVIIEAIIIPFTGFLALLPGPNVFFYVPAILLYYHFTSYQGLKNVDVDLLDIEILIV
jgi:hypothetical protein